MESLLLLCIGSLRWCIKLHFCDVPHPRLESFSWYSIWYGVPQSYLAQPQYVLVKFLLKVEQASIVEKIDIVVEKGWYI